jgi:hypothetical protein
MGKRAKRLFPKETLHNGPKKSLMPKSENQNSGQERKDCLVPTTIEQLNAFFAQLSTNTVNLLPDGILEINIKVLQSLRLLAEEPLPKLASFTTVESDDKITLYNDAFALWIAPQKTEPPTTIVFIARRTAESLVPEMAFRTKGLHNKSKTIIRIIDRFLTEIQETNFVISDLEKGNPKTSTST